MVVLRFTVPNATGLLANDSTDPLPPVPLRAMAVLVARVGPAALWVSVSVAARAVLAPGLNCTVTVQEPAAAGAFAGARATPMQVCDVTVKSAAAVPEAAIAEMVSDRPVGSALVLVTVKTFESDAPPLTVPKFQLVKVAKFTRAGGTGVLITYLADSSANPVTGKVVRDAVESFLFWKNGQLVTLSLSGPQSADNVDPWAKVSGSFRWTP